MDTWATSSTWSNRILTAADHLHGTRGDRLERFRSWSMNPESADTLMKTLLALSIHSLILDAVAQEHPDPSRVIDQTPLTDIAAAATTRPHHELLAGLPPLGGRDQLSVDALRVLIYDGASALPLGRLSQMIRVTLLQLGASLPAENPVCSDVADHTIG